MRTYVACLYVIIKSVDFPWQRVYVVHSLVVRSPRQTIGYVDLIQTRVEGTIDIQSK